MAFEVEVVVEVSHTAVARLQIARGVCRRGHCAPVVGTVVARARTLGGARLLGFGLDVFTVHDDFLAHLQICALFNLSGGALQSLELVLAGVERLGAGSLHRLVVTVRLSSWSQLLLGRLVVFEADALVRDGRSVQRFVEAALEAGMVVLAESLLVQLHFARLLLEAVEG